MTNHLRPTKLNDIIGQEKITGILEIAVSSAKDRNCSIPHLLFSGPPGTGKSTLAMAIGNELGVSTHILNGGELSSPKMLIPSLLKLKSRDILFIDEIHRIPVKIAEMLYTVMEDFSLDLSEMDIEIPRFTMVGATTEAGRLPKPMFDRFVYKLRLQLYSVNELTQIIKKSIDKLGLRIDDSAAGNLAKRCRGTPRIANNLSLWLRDYVLSKGSSVVSNAIIDNAVGMMGIDSNGITEQDRAYLAALKQSGRPMGLKSLSDFLHIDEETIRDIIEPHLISLRKIERTSKGRVLSE